jgi:hypothetical protein
MATSMIAPAMMPAISTGDSIKKVMEADLARLEAALIHTFGARHPVESRVSRSSLTAIKINRRPVPLYLYAFS